MGVAAGLAKLTVVVPVGPGDTLAPQLRAQLASLPMTAQVRVVYAESEAVAARGFDASVEPGPQWHIVAARPGRAAQQNAGAQGASGEWLWFLHADCVLAPASLPALARFIGRGDDALGYFDLRFLDDGPALMRLNAIGAWVRSRWFGLPFGDQGLLLPRELFERLGGFDPALSCGEDHDLVWRVRRAGAPLHAVGAPLFTSARKYAEAGWWAITTGHLAETWRQARRFSRTRGAR